MEKTSFLNDRKLSEVLSPITNSRAIFCEKLDTEKVISIYKNYLAIDIRGIISVETPLSIFKCPDTNYRFYFPLSLEGNDEFYSKLANFSWYYQEWELETRFSIKYLKTSDFVLDIGCGNARFLKILEKKGYRNLFGIDLHYKNEKEENICLSNLPVEEFCKFNEKKFDVVTCFQVLEHTSQVKLFLDSAIKCLKKDGLLIIAVPNSRPYIYKTYKYCALNMPPHHMGLWDKSSMFKIGNYFNLKVIKIKELPLYNDINYYIDIRMDHFSLGRFN